MIDLRAPRYALALSIAVCLAVYLLAGCQTVQSSKTFETYMGCDGVITAVEIETRVGVPAFECIGLAITEKDYLAAALFAISFPAIACANVWFPYAPDPHFRKALIIHYPVTFTAAVEHEQAHAKGMSHPFLLPLEQTHCGEPHDNKVEQWKTVGN